MVGVVAHQRGKVERDGEAGLTVLEQEFVAAVGVRRAAEPRKLPHRPQLAAVHRGMNAARERIFSRPSYLALGVEPAQVRGRVYRLLVNRHVPFLTCARTSAATSYGVRVPAATSSRRLA